MYNSTLFDQGKAKVLSGLEDILASFRPPPADVIPIPPPVPAVFKIL